MIEYDRKLESPRSGYRIQVFGWALIAFAVTWTVVDVTTHHPAWALVNVITFTCSVYNVYMGRRSAHRAIEHHQRMEGMRQSIRASQQRLERFHGPN